MVGEPFGLSATNAGEFFKVGSEFIEIGHEVSK
jgi:hypothetical protein